MWRATQDENANWKAIIKTKSYERRQLSDIGQQLLWIIETADFPPTVAEIVEQLVVDGDPLGPADITDQRDRVANVLINMRRRGLVCSDKIGGDRLRWTLPNADAPSVSQKERPLALAPISDQEWTLLRMHIPLPARRRSSETKTREFLLAVLREALSDLPLMMTPGQQKRFLAWQSLGVWDQLSEALEDRFQSTCIKALEKKIGEGPV